MSLNDQRQFGQNTHKTASLIYIHHPHLIHTVLDNSEEIDESCTLFNAKLNEMFTFCGKNTDVISCIARYIIYKH